MKPYRWLVALVPLAAVSLWASGASAQEERPEKSPIQQRSTQGAAQLDIVTVSAASGRAQRLRELGASVGAADLESLNQAPVTHFGDALTGRVAGLVVQDVSGTTGTSQRLRLRGVRSLRYSNAPVIYLDGVLLNDGLEGFAVGGQEPSRLNDLNPQDIAGIQVLRGPAATARYGTGGANGVILITTKRGVPGETRWAFFAETGSLTDATDYPANHAAFEVIDPRQPRFTETGELNPIHAQFCPNRFAANGACTQDRTLVFNTLRDSRTRPFAEGVRERMGASVAGGTDAARYFLSAQWEDEKGIVFYNTQRKVHLRTNLDLALSESADLSFSMGYADTELTLNYNDNAILSPLLGGLTGYPNYRTNDPRGFEPSPSNYGFRFNLEQLSGVVPMQEVQRYVFGGRAEWRPSSWLTLNATAGLDRADRADSESQLGFFADGVRESQRSSESTYNVGFSGVVERSMPGDLSFTSELGAQYEAEVLASTTCFGGGLGLLPGSCSGATVALSGGEDFSQVRTFGLFAHQAFAWRDRVFLSGGVRGDRSSTFGGDVGFRLFPSVGASWVLSEEGFFPDTDWVSDVRVRGGWGRAGVRPGFRDAWDLYLAGTTVALDGADVPGLRLTQAGNLALRPEVTTEVELGLDAGLFGHRMALGFTWFDRVTEDLVLSVPVPRSLGVGPGSRLDNAGSISASGTEFSLRARLLDTRYLGLTLGFQNATFHSEVVSLGDGPDELRFNRGLQRHTAGYPVGGFWQRPYRWVDPDGDGLLRQQDVTVSEFDVFIGPAIPTWQRILTLDLRLRDVLTVSALLEGRGGHVRGNDSEAFRCGVRPAYGCAAVGDPGATREHQARFLADRFGGTDELRTAFGYVEPADFWRWRELAVTLSVPESLAGRVPALRGLRVTAAARNLAVWTDYSGLDPETNEQGASGGSSNFSESEFNTQPPVRYFMLRLDYAF